MILCVDFSLCLGKHTIKWEKQNKNRLLKIKFAPDVTEGGILKVRQACEIERRKEMKDHVYWKVGELAKRTGLTVRTLHHYDHIGLFSPSHHSDSEHRLYTPADLRKLQNILSLKYLGLSLKEIEEYLAPDTLPNASNILSVQITHLKEEIQTKQSLLQELEQALLLTSDHQELSIEHLTKIIGGMRMDRETYFTKQQLKHMKEIYEIFDQETLEKEIEHVQNTIGRLRVYRERGTSPTHPEVRQLALQWQEQVQKFIPESNPEFMKQAEEFHANNPGNELQQGVDEPLYHYITQALQEQ